MKSVFTARQMRSADAYCENKLNIPTLKLMSRAAVALTKICTKAAPSPCSVLFLCGKGNNAGDGFAAARLMKEGGYDVTVALLCGREFSPDAAVMFRMIPEVLLKETEEEIMAAIPEADLIVDCVYGTGFRGELPDEVQKIFQVAQGKKIIACDVPSGVNCDDGSVSKGTLHAYRTVTFAAYKPCFFLYPAKGFCGKVACADIGIPERALEKQHPGIDLPDEEYVRSLLRPRPENSHKGTFGTLLTVCGSKRMTGAAALSAQGALRCGVGLLTMALPACITPILQAKLSEPVFVPRRGTVKATAVLVGCGLGDDKKALKFALDQAKPTVIDADAINMIAQDPSILDRFLKEHPEARVILTPHSAELARLMNTSVAKIESDRLAAVRQCLDRWNVTLVLKGHHTVIASENRIYMNLTGNSGLSKGGSGDVLAGMIASFLAQGYPPRDAAICGVYLHGAAANQLKEIYSEHGILPSDLPIAVARILKDMETLA